MDEIIVGLEKKLDEIARFFKTSTPKKQRCMQFILQQAIILMNAPT